MILFTFIIEDWPELDSRHSLDEPHNARLLVLQFEDGSTGLQVALAWHDAGLESLTTHPRNDRASALYGYVVVVSGVLNIITLCGIRFPAFGDADFLQLGPEHLSNIAFHIHESGRQRLADGIHRQNTNVGNDFLILGLEILHRMRCHRLLASSQASRLAYVV